MYQLWSIHLWFGSGSVKLVHYLNIFFKVRIICVHKRWECQHKLFSLKKISNISQFTGNQLLVFCQVTQGKHAVLVPICHPSKPPRPTFMSSYSSSYIFSSKFTLFSLSEEGILSFLEFSFIDIYSIWIFNSYQNNQ